MVKPVRPLVNRDDYEWFVKRFGDDGVSPAKGELFSRIRMFIEEPESKTEVINTAINEDIK